jgi:membrane peptidoglycan carboxypeptidase
MLKKLLYGITAFIGLATAGAVLAFFWLVVFYPGEEIQQKNIEKILSMESPVYYSGGRDKIGVFFKEAHRQYIQYDAIPQDFINAIVAAEVRAAVPLPSRPPRTSSKERTARCGPN